MTTTPPPERITETDVDFAAEIEEADEFAAHQRAESHDVDVWTGRVLDREDRPWY